MTIDDLRSRFRGDLLEPASPGFDTARMVWNGMIDRRPKLIVRCRNAADVAAAGDFARETRTSPSPYAAADTMLRAMPSAMAA